MSNTPMTKFCSLKNRFCRLPNRVAKEYHCCYAINRLILSLATLLGRMQFAPTRNHPVFAMDNIAFTMQLFGLVLAKRDPTGSICRVTPRHSGARPDITFVTFFYFCLFVNNLSANAIRPYAKSSDICYGQYRLYYKPL
jgi:hypothetical protein